MKKWSKKWRSSKKKKKQRKYVYQAPLHVRNKFMSAPLSKSLRKKLGIKSQPVRTGDTVKVTTGDLKKTTGKVERVDTKNRKVYIGDVVREKVDGSEVAVGIHPSNLLITKLNTEDKKRFKRLKKEDKK